MKLLILQISSLNGAQLNGSSLLGCSLSFVCGLLRIDLGGSALGDEPRHWLGAVTLFHMSQSPGSFPQVPEEASWDYFYGNVKVQGQSAQLFKRTNKSYTRPLKG